MALPIFVRSVQRRIALALGIEDEDLRTCIVEMLARSGKHAAAYWLQIVLSLGIATFGLVLGSTAVVIGAMLVSPLMTPIVELGMGLAIGSPFLVLRSATRVGSSVALVVLVSAAIIRLLPFHEATPEITSRTSPNVLDLAVAVCCAGAAAYTTVRGAETSATAAGTAVGIALIPPLCVIGYGLGSGAARIAGGAALLFTANFSAIVFFDALVFLLLGYGQVDIRALEAAELAEAKQKGIGRAARALYRFFHSRYGRLMRVLTPLLLVAAIFIPLRTALREVAWQVKTRAAIQEILGGIRQRSVRTSLLVESHEVSVRLVIVGSADDAQALREDLSTRIRIVSGVTPTINVLAVADVETLRQAETLPPAPPPPPPLPGADITSLRGCLTKTLRQGWPSAAVGELVEWGIDLGPNATQLTVLHFGPALGSAAEQIMATELEACVGANQVRVVDHAFAATPFVAPAGAGDAWLAEIVHRIPMLVDEPRVHACIEVPTQDGGTSKVREGLLAAVSVLGDRAETVESTDWSFQAALECSKRSQEDAGVEASSDAL